MDAVVVPPRKRDPKPTVEEVEDEDGPPPTSTRAEELPYRDVPPVVDAKREPALPRKPNPQKTEMPKATSNDTERAYKVTSEVDDGAAVKALKKRILDMEIPVTIRHLMAASNPLQKEMNKVTAKRRRPIFQALQGSESSNFVVRVVDKETGEVVVESELDTEESQSETGSETQSEEPSAEVQAESGDQVPEGAVHIDDLPFDQYVFVTTEASGAVPEGSIVIEDAFVQYHDSLGSGKSGKDIYVGTSSAALRSLYPLINGIGTVETLLDGGSQICSITEAEAIHFGLAWDTSATVLMQGSTGKVERTMGLARNVAFTFPGITVFLQIHVLRTAPYKALLGRPFEIVTSAVIQNKPDGTQTITMTDPVTQRTMTIPTSERGKQRVVGKAEKEHPVLSADSESPKRNF